MRKKKGQTTKFIEWFPRVSAITFVFCLFAFLALDIPKLIENSPLLFNFFFAMIILAVIIMTWKKDKLAGILFIGLSFIYAIFTWESLLAVSTLSTSAWLLLTGVLLVISSSLKTGTRR